MTTKTDNRTEIGLHVFERAGLGLAPFRCVGWNRMTFQATPDSPVQPGGTCDFCGTAIIYAALIQSRDGKQFKVGCDCVSKTGDEGLIEGYKTTPEYRKHQWELSRAKALRVRQELEGLLKDEAIQAKLRAMEHPSAWRREKGDTKLEHLQYCLLNGGDASRWDALKFIKKIIGGAAS